MSRCRLMMIARRNGSFLSERVRQGKEINEKEAKEESLERIDNRRSLPLGINAI